MEIFIVDILSVLFLFFASILKFKTLKNPFFIVCFWWMFFLCLSNIEVIEYAKIDYRTHLIFLLFIFSIFIPSLFFFDSNTIINIDFDLFIRNNKKKIIVLYFFLCCFCLYMGIKGYFLSLTYGNLYRGMSFCSEGYNFDLLYGNYYIRMLVKIFIDPFILLSILIFPIAFIFYKKKYLFFVGFFIAVLTCFKQSGRYPIYLFMLSLILGYVFVSVSILKDKIKRIVLISIIGAVVLFAITYVTSMRSPSKDVFYSATHIENALSQGIKYHILGFHLFNFAYMNEHSELHNNNSFGRLTLSGPDFLGCFFLRRFIPSFVPEVSKIGVVFQQRIYLGRDFSGNAFYTSLYPLYYDFGILGIVIIPIIISYFLTVFYKSYLKLNDFFSLFVVIFLSLFLMGSIFTSKFTSISYWGIVYLIIIMKIFYRKRF